MRHNPAHKDLQSSYTRLTNEELVRRCLDNDRAAWNEFFRRFIPDIKWAIKRTLISSRHPQLFQDVDVLWDIHEEIVINLYSRGRLRQCSDPKGVRSWLREVASNQTIDWLRKRDSKKRMPELVEERNLLSLSTPLTENANITLGDTVSANPEPDNELREYIENAILQMKHIPNEKAFWVLRLSIILYLPLSTEEIEKLARFSGCSAVELDRLVGKMVKRVEVKEEKRSTAAGQAVLIWHEIRRMESLLFEKSTCSSGLDEDEVDEIRRRIKKRTKHREALLKKAQKLCRPSNREMAMLVGLPEEKIDQISNMLARARLMLQVKMSMP